MKLKTIHCPTPAQKGFTISTRPCSTATEQLKEECFNPCLNRDWGDLPRKITEKPEENHPWRHGDKPRVPEACASPRPLNKQHPRDREASTQNAGRPAFHNFQASKCFPH